MQKSPKMLPTWPHHGPQILTKSMQKASPGTDFLGTRKTSKHVQQSTTTIPLWLHHGTEGLPYGKVSSATSAVSQGFSQPASKNTMHFFHFSTIACMHMVSQVMGTGASHNDCEFIMQNRRCLRVLDHVIILYVFGTLQYRYILLYVGNRVIMDTQGMEPF